MQHISYEIKPNQSTTAITDLVKASEELLETYAAVVADRPEMMKLQKCVLRCRGLRSDGRSLELFGGDRR